jgi:Lar family restriction alleviation protein
MTEALKKCPFCGDKPTMIKRSLGLDGYYFFVKCENCKAEINNPRFSEEEAVKDWNHRKSNLVVRR